MSVLKVYLYPAILLGVSGTINWCLISGEIAGLQGEMKEGFEKIETRIDKLRVNVENLAIDVKSYKLENKESKSDLRDIWKDIKALVKRQEAFEVAVNRKIVEELTKCAKKHSQDS